MTTLPDGRMLLDGAVNGEATKFLLYTGAPRTLLDPDFVKSRNLPWVDHDKIQGYGLTGKSLSGFVRVDSLAIGNVNYPNEGLAFGSVAGVPGNPAGVISNDFLSAYDVEIDPSAGKVNLYSWRHCPGQVVYWAPEYSKMPLHLTRNYRPDVEVHVNGQTLRARIDTGMAVTTMRLAVARRLFGVSAESADPNSHVEVSGVDGVKLDGFTHNFDSLTFGDITLRNTKMQVADIDVAKGAENTGTHMTGAVVQPDLYIGMSLLKQLHMFIAYSEPAVYFTVAEPPKTE
ncbi:MAG: aspartyl protease family protein [Aliidongia sp.]